MDYQTQIKRASCKRKTKIKNCIGMKEAYAYYSDTINKLKLSDYRKVVRTINQLIQEAVTNGEDVTLPKKMGELQLRKYKTKVDFKDGKMITNLPIDWFETLKLWEVDKQAEKDKFLVRTESSYIYRVLYKRQKANFKNKTMFQFRTNRSLRLKLKDKIINGNIDAFLVN